MVPALSRYDILGLVASGGMADVWLARMRGPAGFMKLVALKAIRPALTDDPRFTELFLSEARVAAQLNHPNCVQIFDLDEEDGNYFLAMEYVDGFSFKRVLSRANERGAVIPIDVVVRIVIDATNGLDCAHRLTDDAGEPVGLVHRDISPDNILVAFSGQSKVADFGIAKAVSTGRSTQSTNFKGKTGYMAPEYLRGEPIDGRADLFALGVVLYRALTGRSPFEGENDALAMLSVLTEAPPPVRTVNAAIPEPLAAVVEKALEKEPAARFEGARAMRAALEAAVPHVPSPETVAAYMEALWPKEDPERNRVRGWLASSGGTPSGATPVTARARPASRSHTQEASSSPRTSAGPTGDRPTAAPRPPRRRRIELAAAVLALVGVLVAGALFVRGRAREAGGNSTAPIAAAEPKTVVTVLVADFDNRTGDPVFDGTLEPTFNVALEEATFISTFNRGEARRLAQKLPRARETLDEASARLIAVNQGLNVVIAGSLAREGDAYTVSMKAVRPIAGEVVTTTHDRASDKDQVLIAVTKAAITIRQALGDPRSTTNAALPFPTLLSTTSFEAVHEYAIASDAISWGKNEDALRSFSKATELDPNFGLAFAGKAAALRNLGRHDEAIAAIKEALRYVDRMTERERYRTRGMAALFTHNYQTCVQELGALTTRFPYDVGARTNVAYCWFALRNMPNAVEEARRAAEVLPKRVVYRSNLAAYELFSTELAAAERDAAAALELDPSYYKAEGVLALAERGQGKVAEAADHYRHLATRGQVEASAAAACLADMAAYDGRFAEAVDILERAAVVDLEAKRPDRAADKFAALARTELMRGDKLRAEAAADKALANDKQPKIRFVAGVVFAQVGATAKARQLAAALASEVPAESQAYAKLIEGEIALKGSAARDAIKAFSEANNLLDTWIGRLDLARAYLAAGAFAEADAELDRCIARRGEAMFILLDDVPTWASYPMVDYLQGRVREGLRSPGFAESYRAYIAIRGKAAEDPLLVELRRRIGE